MAGFKLKTKVKPQVEVADTTEIEIAPQTETETPEQIVDAIGALAAREEALNDTLMADPRMVEMMEKQRERARLEKDLLERFEGAEKLAVDHTLVGTHFAAKISKGSNVRSITDKDHLVDTLETVKEGLAIELATFKIGDLDKYLTPDQQAEVLTTQATKRRTLKIEPI